MNSEIRKMLEGVRQGTVSVDDALLALKKEPFTDIGYAKVDLHRGIRQGAAEVIYGAGKTPAQMIGIIGAMRRRGQRTILITRLSPEAAQEIAAAYPLDYHEDAHCGILGTVPEPDGIGRIVIATGGTSDIPIAEEAALTAEVHGNEVLRLYDVGVAPHPAPYGRYHERVGDRGHRGNGGGSGQRAGRPGRLSGDRGAHQRGLRRLLRRPVGPAVYAEFLRQRRIGGEH